MNTDIVTETVYHCPHCGKQMDAITNTFEYPTKTVYVVNVTCWDKGCEFYSFTMSPERANDPAVLALTYAVDKKYDVYTGQNYDH